MIGRSGSPRPAPAVAVACVALFTDMLVYGLAIPVLPLLPATVEAGPTATGIGHADPGDHRRCTSGGRPGDRTGWVRAHAPRSLQHSKRTDGSRVQ
jgi:hypothetical protein